MTVGGDFYDFIELAEGRLAVVVGDVVGKGRRAAALTALAKNTVRAFAHEDPPGPALTRANAVLASSVAADEFATAVVLVWRADGAYTYSSAGHPCILISDSRTRYLPGPQGLPLGMFENTACGEATGVVHPGESLILYTDGLLDARRGRELLGEERLLAAAAKLSSKAPQNAADELAQVALDFAGGRLQDDLTIIALRPL